jgi:hypothetical protein
VIPSPKRELTASATSNKIDKSARWDKAAADRSALFQPTLDPELYKSVPQEPDPAQSYEQPKSKHRDWPHAVQQLQHLTDLLPCFGTLPAVAADLALFAAPICRRPAISTLMGITLCGFSAKLALGA